jgi:seryl-tRNA synthetase
MARRRAKSVVTVELFPFLSILACVIGVLTLMITGLALGQMDTPDLEKIERAELFQKVQIQVKTDGKRKEELADLLAKAQMIQQKLEAAMRALEDLRNDAKDVDAAKKRDQQLNLKLLAQADQLLQRINKLQPQFKGLMSQINKLKKELAIRKTPPKPAKVMIRPGGSGRNFKSAAFIECTANDIVQFDKNGKETARYPRGGLNENLAFIEYLDKIATTKRARAVFLVREDAYHTWLIAHRTAESRNCYNAALPVIGQGRIDLSLFLKKD